MISDLSIDPWHVTTGMPDLDDVIGGWRRGGLTTIYSSHPSSCQETLLLKSCEALTKRGLKILYLDINGLAYFKELPENLVLIKVHDWHEQNKIMNTLFRSKKIPYDLIFIGGLTTHYHAEFITAPDEDRRDEAHAELTHMIYQLAMLARRNNIPIIVSNSSVSKWKERYYIPFIGGAAVGYYSKTILFIKPIDPYPLVINRDLSDLVKKVGYENVWILGVEKDPSPLLSNRIIVLVLGKMGSLRVAYHYDGAVMKVKSKKVKNRDILHRGRIGRNVITSGFPTLDLLMEGGLRKSEITLLFGPTMIGKSTLLRQISIKVAEEGYNVLYLDLENSFDPSVEIDFYAVDVAHDLVDAFQRIDIRRPDSLEELNRLLNHLIYTRRFYDLLIVDWIAYHFYPLIRIANPAKRSSLLSLLENIIKNLQCYANIANSAVIVATGTRRAPGNYPSLGGTSLYEAAQRIIKIMPTENWGVRRLSVINRTFHQYSTSKDALMYIGSDGRIRFVPEER